MTSAGLVRDTVYGFAMGSPSIAKGVAGLLPHAHILVAL